MKLFNELWQANQVQFFLVTSHCTPTMPALRSPQSLVCRVRHFYLLPSTFFLFILVAVQIVFASLTTPKTEKQIVFDLWFSVAPQHSQMQINSFAAICISLMVCVNHQRTNVLASSPAFFHLDPGGLAARRRQGHSGYSHSRDHSQLSRHFVDQWRTNVQFAHQKCTGIRSRWLHVSGRDFARPQHTLVDLVKKAKWI